MATAVLTDCVKSTLSGGGGRLGQTGVNAVIWLGRTFVDIRDALLRPARLAQPVN
ncbi:hypothetical protein AB0C68_40865 [Streptomyces tendae]|uniref:hypothetical protein n=1 Tax=Streptomyces tendae TaxID=1932 RepID=UPI003409367E